MIALWIDGVFKRVQESCSAQHRSRFGRLDIDIEQMYKFTISMWFYDFYMVLMEYEFLESVSDNGFCTAL